ncbi:hypothetical protein SESBI_02558 [Sesbania bispinosa]|nr:hypothetical protein SESBI_02558 [Sesbania bispinosa]
MVLGTVAYKSLIVASGVALLVAEAATEVCAFGQMIVGHCCYFMRKGKRDGLKEKRGGGGGGGLGSQECCSVVGATVKKIATIHEKGRLLRCKEVDVRTTCREAVAWWSSGSSFSHFLHFPEDLYFRSEGFVSEFEFSEF